MGLLDSALGGAMGSMLGGGEGGAGGAGALLPALIGMLSQGGGELGGIGGLISRFQSAGLGDIVQSWIGSGQNLPVSAEQLQGVLPEGMVSGLAEKAGMGQGDVLGQLTQLLPQVVDKVTPDGAAPAGGLDLGSLGGMLGGLGGMLGR